ncbi:MAG TPA: prepilin-type N-terminal cleavage/methylation domain-containing protein [Candidatus Saccharimonadales bacterium]|nr:prepilin-type N-terminal cleavage/methylation domain-containing protein [Candidatus Saccharimonadales bacterium]
MGIKTQHGFTIIEVMLFLAVTGMLAVAILVGSGVSINQQRYRDSVNTFKGFIQQQYNETTNVVNSRSGNASCANAVVAEPPDSVPSPQPRGTSECVLMGRLLTVADNGVDLNVSNVVGYRTSLTTPPAPTDLAEITTNYRLGTSPIDDENSQVEWGAQIVKPKTTTLQPFSMMIIRSPLSGSVMTFVKDGVQTDLNGFVAGGILKTNKDICINADAGSFVGSRQAIRISAYASSSTAIEIPSEGDNICD